MSTCEKCNIQILQNYGSGRFCSIVCAKSFSTSKNRKEINEKVSIKLSKTKHECDICHLIFDRIWNLGSHKRTHKRTFESLKKDKSRKKWLLKEKGHICWQCDTKEWRGKPVPLQLDHIDGNSDNNAKDNLRILCANCHAQTDNFAGRNIGKVSDENKRRQSRTINIIRIVPANNRASKT